MRPAAAIEQDSELPEDLTPSDLTPVRSPFESTVEPAGAAAVSLDGSIVEELTSRLPTSELVNIIKGALECGRRNLPFTESDLLRAMTFGSIALPARQVPRGSRAPRG
jgi:hypothetical protein